MKKIFNNLRLSNKMLILYIFSVFIPITLTNFIFYNVTSNNVQQKQMVDLSLSLQKIKNDFEAIIDDAVGISAGYYTNVTIYDLLEQDYEKDIDYIEAYDAYLRRMNTYRPINYALQAINLYTDNPSIIFTGGVYPINQIIDTNWYKELSQLQKSSIIVTRAIASDGVTPTFSIIRELDYFTDNTKMKVIKIDLNPVTLSNIFNSVAFRGNVYLVNGQGEVVYSSDKTIDVTDATMQFNTISFPEDAIIIEENYRNRNYLSDWKIIGIASKQVLFQELIESRRFIVYLAILNFIIPTGIIIVITRSLNLRLLHILRHVRKMKNQHFETMEHEGFKDEIGELTSEFNRMTVKIKELINDVYKANIQKKDIELKHKQAQLSALQSQINPHFLFNVLETIRMRSLIKKEDETAKIIQNMAMILRNSLHWGRDWVRVREELVLIDSFLEIQKYRFDEKLEYSVDMDASCNDCYIPNMAFLPFVENASIHGIEPLKGIGRILIEIKKEVNQLIFTIWDNGVGMTEENLKSILWRIQNEEGMGEKIGIKNVYYRLKMCYGDQFYFDLQSKYGQGTTVIIRLPYFEKELLSTSYPVIENSAHERPTE